jgi:hypothetical protein
MALLALRCLPWPARLNARAFMSSKPIRRKKKRLPLRKSAEYWLKSLDRKKPEIAAVGMWLYFPLIWELTLESPRDSADSADDRYYARSVLFQAHDKAVRQLAGLAAGLALDAGAIVNAGSVCRQLFNAPGDFGIESIYHPKRISDEWPNCLGPARFKLPAPVQDALSQGESVLANLRAKLSLKPDVPAILAQSRTDENAEAPVKSAGPNEMAIIPGAIALGDYRVELSGKPWEVLQAIYQSRFKTLTRDELSKDVWGAESPTDDNIRGCIHFAREALRALYKLAGHKSIEDPLPAVGRGKLLAWRLELPN